MPETLDAERTVLVADVVDVFNPQRGRRSGLIPYVEGMTVLDAIPRDRLAKDPTSYKTSLNGGVVPWRERADTRLKPGDSLTCIVQPQVTGAVALVITVVTAVISAWQAWDAGKRAKIQAHHAARRAARKAQQMADSHTYGWEGIRNSVTPGRPIPLLYGRHRVGGQFVYAETRADTGKKSVLDTVLVVSEGEVEGLEPGTILINGAPTSEYTGITVANRAGTLTQTRMSEVYPTLVPRTLNKPGNNLDLTGASPTTYLSQPGRTGFQLSINTPSGCGITTSAGQGSFQGTVRFDFSLRWRAWPSGAFSSPVTFSSKVMRTYGSGPIGGLAASLNGNTRINVQFKTPTLALDRYELELTLTNIQLTYKQNRSPFPGVPTPTPVYDTSKPVVLTEVREFNESPQVFPKLAVLGFSAIASDKLGGGLPEITSIWKGLKVCVYTAAVGDIIDSDSSGVTNGGAGTDNFNTGAVNWVTLGVQPGDILNITDSGSGPSSQEGKYRILTVSASQLTVETLEGNDPGWSNGTNVTYTIETRSGVCTEQYSQNPAWVTFDILSHPDHGGGAYLNAAKDFDQQSFIDAADFCDVLIPRGLTDPIDSDTSGSTNGGSNQFNAPAAFRFPGSGGVRVDDTLVILSGADAGSYRIDSVFDQSLLVSTVTGGTVTFTGTSGFSWEIRNTERRCKADHYFDGGTNVWEAANAVAKNARLALVRSGGKIRLIPDNTGAVVQYFGMGNIIKGSFSIQYLSHSNLANRIEVQFADEDKDWTQQIVELEDPQVLANNLPVIKTQIEAFGVTRATQAMRIAKYHYMSNRNERMLVNFEVAADAIALEWGDLFKLNHDAVFHRTLNAFGGTTIYPSGRVIRREGSDIVLSDVPIEWLDNLQFVTIRHQDDTTSTAISFYPSGTLSDRIPDSGLDKVQPGDVWTTDTPFVDSPSQILWQVTSITRSGDNRRKISAVSHNPDMYSDPATLDDIDHIGNFPDFNG